MRALKVFLPAIAMMLAVSPSGAQMARPSETSAADIDRWVVEFSNWGRWGPDDQLGAVNLITKEKESRPPHSSKAGFRSHWRMNPRKKSRLLIADPTNTR